MGCLLITFKIKLKQNNYRQKYNFQMQEYKYFDNLQCTVFYVEESLLKGREQEHNMLKSKRSATYLLYNFIPSETSNKFCWRSHSEIPLHVNFLPVPALLYKV